MICLYCKTRLILPDVNFGIINCGNCDSDYLVVEKVPLMVSDKSDFYRYKRKFKRLVDLKNEQS